MSAYAAQAEEEKRQKRLARNRASARLRRLRKKNLVCEKILVIIEFKVARYLLCDGVFNFFFIFLSLPFLLCNGNRSMHMKLKSVSSRRL